MVRISSRSTIFYKRVVPILWFGSGALIATYAIYAGIEQSKIGKFIPTFIVLAGMLVVGYGVMRTLTLGLVDEVWDCGDSIVIRDKEVQVTIALCDCLNVSYSMWRNPPHVTLLLRHETALGTKIDFLPTCPSLYSSMSPLIKDLIVRIDKANCG